MSNLRDDRLASQGGNLEKWTKVGVSHEGTLPTEDELAEVDREDEGAEFDREDEEHEEWPDGAQPGAATHSPTRKRPSPAPPSPPPEQRVRNIRCPVCEKDFLASPVAMDAHVNSHFGTLSPRPLWEDC